MYLYFGSDHFSLEVLKGLHAIKPPLAIVTQPDRPAGRKQQLKPGPLAIYAQEQGLKYVQPENLKSSESQDAVLSFKAELMIVVSFGQILPSSFLARCPALINGHASLLPAYRGASPIQSCLLQGEKQTGMTIMHIVKALDAGPMICYKVLPLEPRETHGSLSHKLITAGIELLTPYVLGKQVPEGQQQDHTMATYCHKLDKSDCHLNPIQQEGEQLDRIIRAFSPQPGAFVVIDTPKGSKQLKIISALLKDSSSLCAGLHRVEHEMFLVGKNGRGLSCQEVQLEGKPVLKTAEFLNGFRGDLRLA